MNYNRLCKLLNKINESFPCLRRIGMYASGSSILGKSMDELRTLSRYRVDTVYMGLESGSNRVLADMHKRERVEDMVRAAHMIRNAGMRMSVMVLLGMGGREYARDHVQGTVRAINAMQPPLLSMLAMVPCKGTALYRRIDTGGFLPLSDVEILIELGLMLRQFELTHTVFRADHASNVLPLKGRLPRDRDRLVSRIEDALARLR